MATRRCNQTCHPNVSPGADDTGGLLRRLREPFLPRKVVLLRAPGPAGEDLAALAPFVRGQEPLDGSAAAYVCRDFACREPTTDPGVMMASLADASSGGPTGRK